MNKEGSNWEMIFKEEKTQTTGLGYEERVLRTSAEALGPDSHVSLGGAVWTGCVKTGLAGSQRCAWSQEPGFEANDPGLRFLACEGE